MAKKKKGTSNQLEVQNAAKTLYANVRFMSIDNPIKTIVVTSSVPNEGKTTTSINLATAIATSGKRVLLVEADMRRRSAASALGVHASAGVYALLSGESQLNGAIVGTSTNNLYFLDTEPNIPNPADLISSKRFKQLVQSLAQNFDYVIFDTPPVGTFVDAAILSTLVDATILVVRPNFVKRADLVEARAQLEKADANVIGVCATFVEGSGSEYYYAYYTEDGKRVKKSDAAVAASTFDAPRGTSAPKGDAFTPLPQQNRSRSGRGASQNGKR